MLQLASKRPLGFLNLTLTSKADGTSHGQMIKPKAYLATLMELIHDYITLCYLDDIPMGYFCTFTLLVSYDIFRVISV